MKNKKFVFLILHYCTIEDTRKSIEAIINTISYKNYDIVVVDNGSKNETGKQLKKEFLNNKNFHIILSDINLGFARGNNVGFKYAKEKLNADFIIMINSDVYMLQENFCNIILEEYKHSNFSILGPKIIMRNNEVCNYNDKLPKLKCLIRQRRQKKILYFFNKHHIRKIYSLIIKINEMIFRKKCIVNTSVRKENVVLNGCCIIFSKIYINIFDGIDERTFLYYEEPLLYMRIKQNNLLSVYNPLLIVKHDENSSTKKTSKNKRLLFDFVLNNELNSLNILIKEMKNNFGGCTDEKEN